ncbi:mannose-6-phosphate isomerase [Phymastichus coffea]|uniref:mannose-6-phosphate isomerase n=1 Tax=Phymastichus coffea TaxID=108790 RepID=UPI00273B82AD|nr:mannose-6-phosphate isomerase [Phymastichus coffea]XP_058798308.1 mannose-6-phosphate isomerase [Phymastichus coffea]XP_058798309.1 mannose-6-phosphate isomerase [Phymastichus coffea]XP_058798310.1 mannose-6-phosphate isomerase [Phymastichus coffea]
MELKCSIKNYAWGKQGIDSIVAGLVKASDPDFVPKDNVPYAELWMGTHPNGPSFLKDTQQSLDDYIQQNSSVLGSAVQKMYGTNLPFLFKVLSIKKALSIQVHPNKEQAEELHRTQPTIYRDNNHKPELTIALTPFEALCGFRPIAEIKSYLRSIPEFRNCIGENKIINLMSSDEVNIKTALKSCFSSLMAQEPEIVAQQLRKLLERLSNLDKTMRQMLNASLFEQLYSDYPGDVGCFGIYLFNYITLQPGEAMYLGANEPHAYLFGDCIECMACSDNVVRAGLTPKMKDVEILVDMLSYVCEPVTAKKFQAVREDECTEVFRPPIPDFAIAKIMISPGKATYNLIPRNTASILIVINGKGEIPVSQILNNGSILFIPANESLNIKISYGCHPMLMFQAFVNTCYK